MDQCTDFEDGGAQKEQKWNNGIAQRLVGSRQIGTFAPEYENSRDGHGVKDPAGENDVRVKLFVFSG